MLAGSAAAILLAGWLIGATGIGGVLVVPVLNQLQGVALQQAIAAASLAFALPGLATASAPTGWWAASRRWRWPAACGDCGGRRSFTKAARFRCLRWVRSAPAWASARR